MSVSYSDEQVEVIDKMIDDVTKKGKMKVCLGGYAGTGKTTIIKELISRLPNFQVCAFTGKATNVLRKKQIHNSETIHSTIYDCIQQNDQVSYILKPKRMFSYSGFIIDEASMVSEELFHDLSHFGKPIIFIGDHGQLPPVGSSKFNLMLNPEYKLETIHRNAGPIAIFANFLRLNNKAKHYNNQSDVITVHDKRYVSIPDIAKFEQVICAYNKTRVNMNIAIRKHLGLPSHPVVGDKIIILKNNRNLNIFNGQQGFIERIDKRTVDIKFENRVARNLQYNPDLFNVEKIDQDILNERRDIVIMDYAYAITCHKAQGDQFDSIAVIEEQSSLWEMNRWCYTAASRAETKILWYT